MSKILLSDKVIRAFCVFLKAVIVLFLLGFAAVAVLCVMGRVEISVFGADTLYHSPVLLSDYLRGGQGDPSGPYVTSQQRLYVTHAESGAVSLLTRCLLVLSPIISALPTALGLLFVCPLLQNIMEKQVFILENARLLLKTGVTLLAGRLLSAVLTIWIFPWLIRGFTDNTLEVSAQLTPFSWGTMLGVILLISSYIFHYGISLQSEVDATL